MSINANTFKAGDHLVTERMLYTHHGIYAGKNQVIHYAGLCDRFKYGAIERTSLEQFASGNDVRVVEHANRKYSHKETLKRAESRIGEDKYSIFSNNCEHFVNWCVHDKKKSEQVSRALSYTFSSFFAILVGTVFAARHFNND